MDLLTNFKLNNNNYNNNKNNNNNNNNNKNKNNNNNNNNNKNNNNNNNKNNKNNNKIYGLRNPEVQCRIHKGSPIIPILSRINQITRIDTYLFKVYSNIVLPSTPRSS